MLTVGFFVNNGYKVRKANIIYPKKFLGIKFTQ